MAERSNKDLLDELGVVADPVKKTKHTAREERIFAGFEEIQRFVEENGHVPAQGEQKDIFERLYATRLEKIRSQVECVKLLQEMDYQGLLKGDQGVAEPPADYSSDEELLAELGVDAPKEGDVSYLKHVKPRAEVKAAEEVANRNLCKDFDSFKPIFDVVQEELETGARETRPFQDYAEIKKGDFFILSGQKVYVADVGDEFVPEHGRPDARLRVIYDNGTESDLLMRSLQRALNKDTAGRRIIDISPGPLFSGLTEEEDLASGTIYVLRSKSDHPAINENRDVIHKIGVTGGKVEQRISNAKLDPTFLMAEVEIVATYELYNINRTKLEKLLHKIFEVVRLDIQIEDRFGNPVMPREWFLVPLFIIDQVVEKIKDKTIDNYIYDVESASLIKINK